MLSNRNRSWEYFGILKEGEIYISAVRVWKTRTYFPFLSMGKFGLFPPNKKGKLSWIHFNNDILFFFSFPSFKYLLISINPNTMQQHDSVTLEGKYFPVKWEIVWTALEDLRSPLRYDLHSPSRTGTDHGDPVCSRVLGYAFCPNRHPDGTMPGAGHTALPQYPWLQ